MRVAIHQCVTRIPGSCETQRRDGGSQFSSRVPFAQRAATADAPRGDYLRLALSVEHAAAPAAHAHRRSGRWTVSLVGGTVHRLPLATFSRNVACTGNRLGPPLKRLRSRCATGRAAPVDSWSQTIGRHQPVHTGSFTNQRPQITRTALCPFLALFEQQPAD
jgi:hypothetical protein